MGLRFRIAAFSFALLCLVFPHKSFADTLTLESANQVYYPYQFSINGSSTYTALSCLNDTREVQVGESWSVYADNLESLILAGNSIDGASLSELKADAYLDSLYNTAAGTNSNIQDAIWAVQNFSDVSGLDGASLLLYNTAESYSGTSSFYSQFEVYLPVVPVGSAPSNWDGLGEPQEFMGYTPASPTPEPSSLLLLGSGILSAAELVRRRVKGVMA